MWGDLLMAAGLLAMFGMGVWFGYHADRLEDLDDPAWLDDEALTPSDESPWGRH